MRDDMQFELYSEGGLQGQLAAAWCRAGGTPFANMAALVASGRILHAGRHTTVVVTVMGPQGRQAIAVKAFGAQSMLKDHLDRTRGSKARRSWGAAVHLASYGVSTPAPIGYLERWGGGGIAESYYLSVYEGETVSFADELARLFEEDPETQRFMVLMARVAAFVRGMHAAGFLHQDLGNQNILMRTTAAGDWQDLMVIDLNRGRAVSRLDLRQRARDLSRISLPSDFRRIFLEMYWQDVPPAALLVWEHRFRRRFARHTASRSWRHPVRTWRERHATQVHRYPVDRDLWVWDERSGQALTVHASRERSKLYPLNRHLRVLSVVGDAIRAWRAYRRLLPEAFARPVVLDDRLGVAIEPPVGEESASFGRVRELGLTRLQVRFYRHAGPQQWARAADLVARAHAEGMHLGICLLQDRLAVRQPELWETFCCEVFTLVRGKVDEIEVAHAINRVKWGIWDWREYRQLLEATWRAVDEVWAEAPLTGPAAIDFEYHYVLAALRQVPAGRAFSALSHHLYVDRRGAPENRQGGFALIEKAAMALAIARSSRACKGGLVVSEVNWPLHGTGVHSPVGAPYESPGERHNDPSVSEQAYACFMLRYALLGLCSGFVDRIYWWRLVAHGYGLVDATPGEPGRRRPAFTALRNLMRACRGATYTHALRRGDVSGDGVWQLAFEGPEGTFQIAWSEHDGMELSTSSVTGARCLVSGKTIDPHELLLGPAPVLLLCGS